MNGTAKENRNQTLIQMIHNVVVPATGCTEPVAIALNSATAKMALKGKVQKVYLKLDAGLLKNAMGVAIPGISSRGPASCAAVGILIGTNERGMDILSSASSCHDSQVNALTPLIKVSIAEGCNNLFIETVLVSEADKVRVITEQRHANVVSVEHADKAGNFTEWAVSQQDDFAQMDTMELVDLIDFADTVNEKELDFFRKGVEMNTAIVSRGMGTLVGESNRKLKEQGCFGDSLVFKVGNCASSASYARMSGEMLPVMTVTGSGNQGITLFIPIWAVAQEKKIPEEKMLRAIAFAQAFNLFSKHYVGVLSPMCSCGISSGVAASVGIVYMLGGNISQIEGTIRTMLGCITGMVCDGAKESCASKVGISTGLAVFSAMMSLNDVSTQRGGIVTSDIKELYKCVGSLSTYGMERANNIMIKMMLNRGE